MKTIFILTALFLLSLASSSNALSKGISKGQAKQSLANESLVEQYRVEQYREKKYQCKLISRSDAINSAKRQLSGKVVGVQLDNSGKRSVYRVRILTAKKRVKTISIQACR